LSNIISRTGSSSFVSESPINQVKVAKLVLKPVQSKAKRAITNNHQMKQSPVAEISSQNKGDQLMKKSDIELENEMATEQQQQQQPSPIHKSKLDETARNEAREFMKKQREKRKMDVKKEVDKSFIIKQRLEELKKSTKDAVIKNIKKSKNSIKKSPPKDDSYYSMFNMNMKEVKELRLKPMSRASRREEVELSANKLPASPRVSSPKKPPLSPVINLQRRQPLSPKKPPSPLKIINNIAKVWQT
jgi:hypothetical protein